MKVFRPEMGEGSVLKMLITWTCKLGQETGVKCVRWITVLYQFLCTVVTEATDAPIAGPSLTDTDYISTLNFRIEKVASGGIRKSGCCPLSPFCIQSLPRQCYDQELQPTSGIRPGPRRTIKGGQGHCYFLGKPEFRVI